MLKFATINPTTLGDFPENEPLLAITNLMPKTGQVYRIHKVCGSTVCLAPGYSRDEHHRVLVDTVPFGTKFKVEMPSKKFLTKYKVRTSDTLELCFDEDGSAFFLTENATTVELQECVDQTQLRLVSMPSITH